MDWQGNRIHFCVWLCTFTLREFPCNLSRKFLFILGATSVYRCDGKYFDDIDCSFTAGHFHIYFLVHTLLWVTRVSKGRPLTGGDCYWFLLTKCTCPFRKQSYEARVSLKTFLFCCCCCLVTASRYWTIVNVLSVHY